MAYFKYEQVADKLTELILNKTYVAGEKIPTEDELSQQFQVGRQTVRKAVVLLEESGYLKKVQGSGTYVCKRADGAEESVPQVENPGTIALVMMNSDYIFLDIMKGASEYLLEKKYMLNSIVTDGDYEKERLVLERLLKNLPAGLIFEPVCSGFLSMNKPLFEKIAARIPCLLLHMDSTERFPVLPLRDREALDKMLRNVTAVICHDDRVAHRLIQYLDGKGIRVPEDISVTGYDDSAYSVLNLPITTVVHPKTEYGRKAAQALLDLMHRPEDIHMDKYTIEPQIVIRASTAPPAAK